MVTKGPLLGLWASGGTIPVSELLGRGKQFSWPVDEAQQVECQGECKEGAFCERVEGDRKVCQLSARMTVPGHGRVRASDCMWPIASAKA